MTSAKPVILWIGHIPCRDLFPCCWTNTSFDKLNKEVSGIYCKAYFDQIVQHTSAALILSLLCVLVG